MGSWALCNVAIREGSLTALALSDSAQLAHEINLLVQTGKMRKYTSFYSTTSIYVTFNTKGYNVCRLSCLFLFLKTCVIISFTFWFPKQQP